MSKIETLVQDIYDIFEKQKKIPKGLVVSFGESLARMLADRIVDDKGPPTLRLSNLGKPCRRQLWYQINVPELGEPLDGPTRLKFLLGDIFEEVMLFLAKVAGHKVEREQETVEVHGVVGHIDATIDGELVDCKSASPYSFDKFKDHRLNEDDPFGYLTQLGSYRTAVGGERAHFLAGNKVSGSLALDTWYDDGKDYKELVDVTRQQLSSPTPPPRAYDDKPDGKSGNRRLGVACSYCSHKTTCWPGVKAYYYSSGPRYLTKVVREPRVDPVGDAGF